MQRDGYKLTVPAELPQIEQKGKEEYEGRFNRFNNDREDRNREWGNKRFGNRERNGGFEERQFPDRGRERERNDGDKDFKKIFIANLSYDSQVRDLRNHFEEKGHRPYDVYIVEDRDGKSKGFGYVKFGDENDAKSALEDLNQTRLQGKNLKMEFAINRKRE